MNTKKDCCDLRDASHALSAEYPCTCLCHLDSTQESGPSEEKIQAGLKALFGPAPQHTSPEKEERRYFGRELGAYAEEQRPDDWTLSKHPTFLQGGSSVEIVPTGGIKEILNDKDTMLEVARKATDDQREQIGLPPLDPNQMMHDLHNEINDGLDKLYAPTDSWKGIQSCIESKPHEQYGRVDMWALDKAIKDLIAQERKEAMLHGFKVATEEKMDGLWETIRKEAKREAVEYIKENCPPIKAHGHEDKLYIEIDKMPEGTSFQILPDTVLEAALTEE